MMPKRSAGLFDDSFLKIIHGFLCHDIYITGHSFFVCLLFMIDSSSFLRKDCILITSHPLQSTCEHIAE